MWFTSFTLTIEKRVEKLVCYESLDILYRYLVRYYRQPRHRSISTIYILITQPTMISQD